MFLKKEFSFLSTRLPTQTTGAQWCLWPGLTAERAPALSTAQQSLQPQSKCDTWLRASQWSPRSGWAQSLVHCPAKPTATQSKCDTWLRASQWSLRSGWAQSLTGVKREWREHLYQSWDWSSKFTVKHNDSMNSPGYFCVCIWLWAIYYCPPWTRGGRLPSLVLLVSTASHFPERYSKDTTGIGSDQLKLMTSMIHLLDFPYLKP